MKVKSESEITQSCPTPSDPMDCSPPGSSVHGIFQARVLEWGAIAFSDTSLQGSQMVSTLNSNQAFLLIREVGIFSSKQSPALAAKPLLWWPSLCFCSLFSVSSEFPNQCCELLGCQREILCFFSPVLPIDYSYLPCARGWNCLWEVCNYKKFLFGFWMECSEGDYSVVLFPNPFFWICWYLV